jgi:ribosomal protein L11 methyltransferase
MSSIIEIQFTLPDASGELAAPLLTRFAPQGWEETNGAVSTKYRVYFPDKDTAGEFARQAKKTWPDVNYIVREKEPENWAMAWKEFFVPVTCGERFEILPPWLTDDASPDLTPIIIDPKNAFGTGHHPTTALCLKLIAEINDDLDTSTLTFLDLGTGSGILAIGLAMLGMTGLGVDIDPDAVPCALENAQTNGVAEHIRFAVGTMDCLHPDQKFDVIVANILSGPLIELAPALLAHLATEGRLILSGILAEQADKVADAYVVRGMQRPQILIEGEWCALLFAQAPARVSS